MKPVLLTIVIILYGSFLEYKAEKNEALVFDRITHLLFYIPRHIPQNAECDPWALACPAETSQEVNSSMKYSITKKPLFVKKLYQRGSKMSTVVKNICEELTQISLTYSVKNSAFQLGFEVYYDSDQSKYFHESRIENYRSIENVLTAMKIISSSKMNIVDEEVTRVLKNSFNDDINELWIGDNQRMGFTWVNLVEFKFDFSKNIIKQAVYNIDTNSKWPVLAEQCEDYSLGNEFYENIIVDNLYSSKRRTLFADSKNPSHKCGSNANCFKKLIIVPMDQFRSGSSIPLCSNMLTIPVWRDSNLQKIEYMLKKVDQYLYLLFRTIGTPLRVIAGTSGENQFVIKKGWKKSKSTIYLEPDREKIPVPNVIYKIVEYRLNNCKLEELSCWYSTIIVIHNDPLFDPKDSNARLCPDTYAESHNWESITKNYLGVKQDFIYVCPRYENIEMKLCGTSSRRMIPGNEIIDLGAFPVTKDGVHISSTRVEQILDSKFDRYDRKGEDLDNVTKKMIEWNLENYSNSNDGEPWKPNSHSYDALDPKKKAVNPNTRYLRLNEEFENSIDS